MANYLRTSQITRMTLASSPGKLHTSQITRMVLASAPGKLKTSQVTRMVLIGTLVPPKPLRTIQTEPF